MQRQRGAHPVAPHARTSCFAAQCGPKLDANAITLRLQPNEGISLRFNGKVPGTSLAVRPVRMHFSYDSEFGAYTPEAYGNGCCSMRPSPATPRYFIRHATAAIARRQWAHRGLHSARVGGPEPDQPGILRRRDLGPERLAEALIAQRQPCLARSAAAKIGAAGFHVQGGKRK